MLAEGVLPPVVSREGCSPGSLWSQGGGGGWGAAFGSKSESATVPWAREGSQAQVLPPVTEGSPLSLCLFHCLGLSVPTNDETDQL